MVRVVSIGTPIGYAWLVREGGLPTPWPMPVQTFVGPRLREITTDGVCRLERPASYWPGETDFDHLSYALRHEGLNLPVVWHACHRLNPVALARRLDEQPQSAQGHRLGWLYEWLTGTTLPLQRKRTGTYVPLVDPAAYITSSTIKMARWRVIHNIGGGPAYCPVVRRTPGVEKCLAWFPLASLEQLQIRYPAALFARAADWLYLSETRSTNEIERETPSPQRTERFVQLLHRAGELPLSEAIAEETLEDIQRACVDAKLRLTPGVRTGPLYVGRQTRLSGLPRVDYLCPSARDLPALLEGWRQAVAAPWPHPLLRAAVAKYGFVFIHPFEDGNGRVSRYLIHDSLSRDGFTPPGLLLPVSAILLRRLDDYRRSLESYSRPVQNVVRLRFDDQDMPWAENTDELTPLYRFPDLTAAVEFLYDATRQCAETEIEEELAFLRDFDTLRARVAETLDLPDRRLDLLIALVHQNLGRLSRNKRQTQFADLSDAEVARLEVLYQEVFASRAAGERAELDNQ